LLSANGDLQRDPHDVAGSEFAVVVPPSGILVAVSTSQRSYASGGDTFHAIWQAAAMTTLEGIVTGVVVAVSFIGMALVALVRRADRRAPVEMDSTHDDPNSR
jgi:hypothetical protein